MAILAITPGEPAGIGPDLVIQAAQQQRSSAWVVVADKHMLTRRALELDLPLKIDEQISAPSTHAGSISVKHVPLTYAVNAGKLDSRNAPGVLAALDSAIEGCLSGQFHALVTGPMQKSVINDAGIEFSGHTEYLAEKSASEDVVMMLMNPSMKVALTTTHLPLNKVAKAITPALLRRRLLILHRALEGEFAIPKPTILVCGLNPHAGESGHLGREEIEVIEPVCAQLRDQGLNIVGPLPADTLFTQNHLAQADAVMSMFHDQGLPVLKYSGFGEAVNVTLGLPFPRTSVDHGTALDLAASGQADGGSLQAALAVAETLSQGVHATA